MNIYVIKCRKDGSNELDEFFFTEVDDAFLFELFIAMTPDVKIIKRIKAEIMTKKDLFDAIKQQIPDAEVFIKSLHDTPKN